MSPILPLTTSTIRPKRHAHASVSGGVVSFHHTDTQWQVQAELIDELFDSAGLKLAEWEQNQQTTIVKNGPHRTVYHLQLESGGYFIKHFKADDWKTRLRQFITPTRADQEYRAVHRVAELGIPTFETVALGEQQCFANLGVADNYLISKEISEVISVQDYVNNMGNEIPATIRQQLATHIGQIVGKLHAGGLIHRDLHSDNLLMKITHDQQGKQQLKLWLIDLHAVSFVKQISTAQIEKNIALLIPSFFKQITKADFLRFMQAYYNTLHCKLPTSLQAIINVSGSQTNLFHKLTGSFRKRVSAIFLKQDKKWSRGNRRLIIADSHNTECRGLVDIGKEKLITLRDNPATIKTTSFHDDKTPTVVTVREDESKNFSAQSGWETGHAFLRRGFKTPRPIMFVADADKEYLATEKITHLPTLTEKLLTATPVERDSISRRLASRFAKLHQFGYDTSFHADDIRIGGTAKRPEIWFCQLDTVTHLNKLTTAQIRVSLQILHQDLTASQQISPTESLRFLKRYISHHPSIHWKDFFQAGNTTDVAPMAK